MSLNTFVHLKPDSPFCKMFASGIVPVQNFVPERGVMGDTGVYEFFRVDVAKLSPEQFDLVCQFVATQCHGTPEEVAAYMRQEGFIPLRALHVAGVATDTRAFL